MKESKPYPHFEEEDGSCLTASEPAAALTRPDTRTQAQSRHVPGLPETWDELMECLKKGEEELERGDYIPGEDVFNSIRVRIRNYAS